jgi:hypothetical protein
MVACFAIISGLVLNSVVIIFILILSNSINARYTKKHGAPITLPLKYKNKMELIKRLMIATFALGLLVLYNLFYYNVYLKHNLVLLLSHMELKYIYEYRFLFFTLAASFAIMGISGKQVFEANEFSKLSRHALSAPAPQSNGSNNSTTSNNAQFSLSGFISQSMNKYYWMINGYVRR